MKAGDLVTMPGESLMAGDDMSVGLIVDDNVRFPGGNKRIGVWWSGEDRIDYEPVDWLEVIGEVI
mgnify:CR=1 FL=1